jgi:predicted secreted Zn-dependent protease
VLETPYDVALVANRIGKQIENDLRTIVNDIGCHCMVSDKDNGRYKISMEKIENSREKNVLYKWGFVANFKSRFWRLEIYTTQGLTVPESRRPLSNSANRRIIRKNDKILF